MLHPYELAIALRHIRSRSRNRFISFISVISMAGTALAVAVLIMVLSVMNGFEYEVRNRILQVVAHASVIGLDGHIGNWQALTAVALADPEVRAVARFVDGQAMLVGKSEIRGVQIRGVDPVAELGTSALGELMVEGDLTALRPGGFGLVIGRTLAEQLGVGLGEDLVMLVSQGTTTPAGVVPRMRRFTVVGIFYAGMHEFDRSLAFLHLGDAQRLLRFGNDVSGLRLAVRDPLQAPAVVRTVASAWGEGAYVTDWTNEHGNFFRSIQLTRSIVFVILLLVVAVAAFNIVSTLVMVVRDKTRRDRHFAYARRVACGDHDGLCLPGRHHRPDRDHRRGGRRCPGCVECQFDHRPDRADFRIPVSCARCLFHQRAAEPVAVVGCLAGGGDRSGPQPGVHGLSSLARCPDRTGRGIAS